MLLMTRGYYGYPMYFDPTYLLVIIGMLLCLGASAYVKSTMNKYSRIRSQRGLSGAEIATRILSQEGINDVRVECLQNNRGDHYDPKNKVVRLSHENYHSSSITAVGVAAHECGHAIQHAKGYSFLQVRSALVPVVNIGSTLGIPLIFIGVFLSWNSVLIQIGILAFSLSVLFQLVTLPVEFNASSRAVAKVEQYGLLSVEENEGCKKVLRAAAFTYVAAAASSILQLLRLVLLFGGRGRSNRND